jgi:hypothetical protein
MMTKAAHVTPDSDRNQETDVKALDINTKLGKRCHLKIKLSIIPLYLKQKILQSHINNIVKFSLI